MASSAFGAIKSIPGSLLGAGLAGGMNMIGNEQSNTANAALAQKQMDFQERMSSTSYQRGVKDMEAAGLNPMLGYSQGGASTPGGAMATMRPISQGVAEAATSAYSAKVNADNVAQDTANKEAAAPGIKADVQAKKEDAEIKYWEAFKNQYITSGAMDRLKELGAAQTNSAIAAHNADAMRSQLETKFLGQTGNLGDYLDLIGKVLPFHSFMNSAVGANRPLFTGK